MLQQDVRLQEEVSLHLKRSPLSAVVKELGRQTGVAVSASPDVADEPVIVSVTKRPAKDVMHQLASLFDYRWTRRGKPDKYSYEIYQDLKSKREEEILRQGKRREALTALQTPVRERLLLVRRSPEELHKEADAREASLRAATQGYAGLPEEQQSAVFQTAEFRALVSLSASIPRLREMADPLQRALCGVVASLTPAQWAELSAGETVLFSTRPEAGTTLLPAPLARQLRSVRPSPRPPGSEGTSASPKVGEAFRSAAQRLAQAWSAAEQFRITVWLDIGSRSFGPLDMVSEAGSAPSLQATLHVIPTPVLPGDLRIGPLPLFGLAIAGHEVPRAQTSPLTGPPPPPVHDPVLQTVRRFQLDLEAPVPGRLSGVVLNDILPRIAETYGIDLIADAYRNRSFSPPLPPSGDELALIEVLNRYVLPFAAWKQESGFLQVRSYEWYHARMAEIPDRVVQHWLVRLRNRRRLSLDDAASLALALRDEQLAEFEDAIREEGIWLVSAEAGRQDFHEAMLRNKEVLRAYAHLSPAQRRALQAGKAVDLAAMPSEALRWCLAALAQRQRVAADPHKRWGYELPVHLAPGSVPDTLSLVHRRGAARVPASQPEEHVEFQFWYRAASTRVLFSVSLPKVEVDRLERQPPSHETVTDPGGKDSTAYGGPP